MSKQKYQVYKAVGETDIDRDESKSSVEIKPSATRRVLSAGKSVLSVINEILKIFTT